MKGFLKVIFYILLIAVPVFFTLAPLVAIIISGAPNDLGIYFCLTVEIENIITAIVRALVMLLLYFTLFELADDNVGRLLFFGNNGLSMVGGKQVKIGRTINNIIWEGRWIDLVWGPQKLRAAIFRQRVSSFSVQDDYLFIKIVTCHRNKGLYKAVAAEKAEAVPKEE